jgi:hypothetical protein
MIAINAGVDSKNQKPEDTVQMLHDIQIAKLSTMTLLAWNGYHSMMGDKWCPYDIILILQKRIVGGRVVVAQRNEDGCYAIEFHGLKARFSNRKIPRPEFLAIATVDRWMRFPIFLHRSEVTKGSLLHFREADFARDVASERMARCAELLATVPR